MSDLSKIIHRFTGLPEEQLSIENILTIVQMHGAIQEAAAALVAGTTPTATPADLLKQAEAAALAALAPKVESWLKDEALNVAEPDLDAIISTIASKYGLDQTVVLTTVHEAEMEFLNYALTKVSDLLTPPPAA